MMLKLSSFAYHTLLQNHQPIVTIPLYCNDIPHDI